MIYHIVLFKFNKTTTEKDIFQIMSKFEKCKNKINGFIDFIHGKNISSKVHLSMDYNYWVIMIFDDIESIKNYNNLPEHKEAQDL